MEAEMAKQRWKGSMKAFQSHIDPQKEEQLKCIKIEIENKVKRIVKLSKSINKGSRDGNLRRKSELIQLIDDFHKQYQSLYAMYENLRGQVKYNLYAKVEDDSASSSSSVSDSEAYHSPWQFAGEGSSYFSNTANLDLDSLPVSPTSSGQEIENSMTDKLTKESAWLKEKVTEKEEQLWSLNKKYEVHESERLAEKKRLDDQIVVRKLELETACVQNKELEEHIKQLEKGNSGLQSHVQELEAAFREKEEKFTDLLTRFEENQANSKWRIGDLMARANCLQQELDSLYTEKNEQLKSLNDQKSELELSLEKKNHEATVQVKDLTDKIKFLQHELETRETEKVCLQSQVEKEKHESSQSLTQMENQNIELTLKITDQEKSFRENEVIITKLNKEHKQMKIKLEDSKINLHNAEKKIEEMTEELRKKFEDGLRILSRRIRVAEQMHLENKEWYQKTRDSYVKENNNLKEKNTRLQVGIRGIKDITLTANNTLASLDTLALKFEESTGHFFNRISKVSCELKFVKDWVMRKNKAIVHIQDDLDCLLSQLDDKEGEILVYREKVWKSDNKVRELEKMIKEKDDGMLSLKEEKREAIRQLCIWIDYHRSRSDYYQKSLSAFGSSRNL